MAREAGIFVDGRSVGDVDIEVFDEGDFGLAPPPASYTPFTYDKMPDTGLPGDRQPTFRGSGHGVGGHGIGPGARHHAATHKTPVFRGRGVAGKHKHIQPTFTKPDGTQAPAPYKGGPIFRPHMTPRGKAPPAKPEHITLADVKAATGVAAPSAKPGHITLTDVGRATAGKVSPAKPEHLTVGGVHEAVAGAHQTGDLSKSAYERMFRGTALANQYGNVVKAARENGVSPSLMASIMAHETARGTSNMLRTRNNPAGLMDPATDGRTGQNFSTIEGGIEEAGRRIGRDYRLGGETIEGMAGIYAPAGAANDPRNLNRGWSSGVRMYQNRLRGSGEEGGGAPVGVTRLPADPAFGGPPGAAPPANVPAGAPGALLAPGGQPPAAFIVHHTAGGGTPRGIVEDWRAHRPGVGTQYIMDRQGVIHDVGAEFGYHGHGHFLHSQIPGVSNQTAVGMEIIARNDADITPQQRANAIEFIRRTYPGVPAYGHSEVSPGDRTNEGVEIARTIRGMHNVGAVGEAAQRAGGVHPEAATHPGLGMPAGKALQEARKIAAAQGFDPNKVSVGEKEYVIKFGPGGKREKTTIEDTPAAGVYHPDTNTIQIYPQNITPSQLEGLLSHEIEHAKVEKYMRAHGWPSAQESLSAIERGKPPTFRGGIGPKAHPSVSEYGEEYVSSTPRGPVFRGYEGGESIGPGFGKTQAARNALNENLAEMARIKNEMRRGHLAQREGDRPAGRFTPALEEIYRKIEEEWKNKK